MVQLVKGLTLGFGSGHDLGAMGSSPMSGPTLKCGVCLGFVLSLSLCPYPYPTLSLKMDGQIF